MHYCSACHRLELALRWRSCCWPPEAPSLRTTGARLSVRAVGGSVIEGADIDIDIALLTYGHPVVLGTRLGGLFAAVPLGDVTGTLSVSGVDYSGSSIPLGDVIVGWVQNLVGPAAATGKEFASTKPGFTFSTLARVTAPTGDYTSERVINLGANRWLLQVGTPIAYYVGDSILDPRLTTFELVPSVTFFSANDDPNGADRIEQKPLFRLEGHVTSNLDPRIWVSFDGLYGVGAATTTDGIADENTQSQLALGGTVSVTLNTHMSLKATYGTVVRNEFGADGDMFRVIAAVLF
jgi:hypothetical protein